MKLLVFYPLVYLCILPFIDAANVLIDKVVLLKADSICTEKILTNTINTAKAKRTSHDLKISSYNIRLGSGKDGDNKWENRKGATFAMISTQIPSVIGVQEALKYQLDDILSNCPAYSYVGVGREDGLYSGEIMAVLWNKKELALLDWGNIWLSETPDTPSIGWDATYIRTATWAKFRAYRSQKVFYMINTHLDNRGSKSRKEGLALILTKIGNINTENLPVVLVGDFNIEKDDPLIASLSEKMDNIREKALSSDEIASFNGFGRVESRTLDYIFSSGFENSISFQTDTTRYNSAPYISDHFPIHAVLKFNSKAKREE